ncbi:MAG: bifunctional metallophosphatase/5'-nucleotidase [Atopobiaceae bacterium]|nr:bifunctional metallophosphatase/5'-nucleotidase [Atopobiaceae bacterium]
MNQRLRILFSSDVHGCVCAHSYADGSAIPGSFERLSSLIAEMRDDMTVLIDGGDTIEGSPLTSFHERTGQLGPSPSSLAMAAIGYDYMVPGNHDFSYGTEAFERHLSSCKALPLCCNLTRVSSELTAHPSEMTDRVELLDYAIQSYGEHYVACIGATTHFVPRWEPPEHLAGLEFADAFEAVRSTVEHVRREHHPDVVIVIYHGGFENEPDKTSLPLSQTGENQAWRMLHEIEGIDVLLTGHTHLPICEQITGPDGRLVSCVQPGAQGTYLACIDIELDTRKQHAQLISVDETTAARDSRIPELVHEQEQACQTWLDKPLGTSLVNLAIHDESSARVNKAPLITFLNLVQTEATGAQLSGTALFTGATGFGETITMRDLVISYPFSNTLALKRVTGAQLKAYLEKCAEYFSLEGECIVVAPDYANPPKDFNYDMVDGIDYTIDVSCPCKSRIKNLSYEGKPVADSDSFTLVVNNYRAAGGGDFPMIEEAETLSENLTDMVELIADYIARHSPIDFEHTHNIHVVAHDTQA